MSIHGANGGETTPVQIQVDLLKGRPEFGQARWIRLVEFGQVQTGGKYGRQTGRQDQGLHFFVLFDLSDGCRNSLAPKNNEDWKDRTREITKNYIVSLTWSSDRSMHPFYPLSVVVSYVYIRTFPTIKNLLAVDSI
jgi:hypothetical protein